AVATPTPTPTPTPAPVATPAPSAANNGPVVQYHPTLGRMYLHGARSAGAQTNNAQLRSTPQPTPAPAPASATQQQADIQNPRSWHPGGTWQQGNVSNLWNWDGLNLSGMEQWMGFGRYGAQQPAETWGQSEHPWQWWSANNPWYWAGTNNPWQWGLDIPRQVYDENGEPRLNADGTPMMWNEEFGHPYQWHANQQGNPGRPGSFPWTNNDGSGLWDPNASTPWGSGNPGPWAANSMWQFDADPGLGEGDGYNPWRWGFVNYPNLGFIWKPQLYLRGGNGEYIPYFPGITNHIGQVYILQGTEFVPYRPRFDGPREWEYFSFEENAQDLFHNFRDPQWDQHVGSLYFFDHHAGRFLPYFGPPLR
ncbi:MAG: hypothetical protein FWD96_03275, partial [Defluviitaleaceae bacterium]|nr:hypothetical protein [Defluviitaleaceae bacterium]